VSAPALFARSPDSNPEKLDARIDVPCSSRLDEVVQAVATLQGMGKAELVRTILEEHFFGRWPVIQRKLNRGDPESIR
jgi:hypothetical protein